MKLTEKAELMDKDGMERSVTRIAHEIIERNRGLENIYIIGIQRRGVSLGRRIADKLYEIENVKIQMGILDITMYRDDLSILWEHPKINGTEIDFSVDKTKIILADDVLYTGRTVRAAIDALMELGRPDMIQLAVMVDRGHRELPIRADYVGKNVPTSSNEIVEVRMTEFDGEDKIVLLEKGE